MSKIIKRFVPIESLKQDEVFKLKENTNIVYVRDGYNRNTKKYEAYKWSDICAFKSLKKGTLVFIDFEF